MEGRRSKHLSPLAVGTLALLALLASGCGTGAELTSTSANAARASDFPDPGKKTLEEIARDGEQSGLAVVPMESVFDVGRNRYGFGVFTTAADNVPDAQLALYASLPGRPAIGPFPASVASLETDPAFRSQTTAEDPDAAASLYTAKVDFPRKGGWQVLAMVRDSSGALSYSVVNTADVGERTAIPDVGDPAPRIHTPTTKDVSDVTKIDTRTPADTMHGTDLADVLGKRPVVLVLATPALCTSRVCGPVVDIAEQVKSERSADAAFVHMEIYEDNDPKKGPRQQVRAFGLKSEPWLFVIDSDGKVSTRIEGAFSADELNAALDKVS